MKKLFKDILTTNKIYSHKKVISFIIIIQIIIITNYVLVSDYLLTKEINRYVIDVFASLLLFEASILGIAELGKKFLNKQEPVKEE